MKKRGKGVLGYYGAFMGRGELLVRIDSDEMKS